MNEKEINKLENIAQSLIDLNAKIKLLLLLEKAKLEYDKNNYDKCSEICNEILKTEPQNTSALRGLGCVMQSLQKYEDAIEYYKQALKYSQKKEIEYTLIGTVFYIQENFDKAIKYFNKAINYNDNYDPAYEGKNQSMLEAHLKISDIQESLIKRNFLNPH